ncbi:MAG: hypothetical protein OHK0023_09460 [Anaerolineae bacterium]
MQGSGSFRLIVRRGPQPNQIYELNKDVISLGRDITNDIVVNDPEVSRHHCRLTRGAGGYTMEDLGSTNGTFVNGQRLNAPRPLNGGDLIGLGETVTLAYESTIAAVAPEFGVARPPMLSNQPPASPGYAQPASGQPPAPSYGAPMPPQTGAPGYGQAPTSQPPGYGQPTMPPGQFQQPVAGYGQPSQPQGQYGQVGQPGQPGYQQFGYQYPDQPVIPQQQGLGRWFFIGCGCFIVLCIVVGIAAALIIDGDPNLRCGLPIVKQIYQTFNPNACPPAQ